MSLETWEMLSYVVTVVDYQLLSDNYQDFLRAVLEHPDLKQGERRTVIFGMLISLFERAYLLLFEPTLSPSSQRRWASWEDYMREWLARDAFRTQLPELVKGEDPEFATYIQALAARFESARKS